MRTAQGCDVSVRKPCRLGPFPSALFPTLRYTEEMSKKKENESRIA